MPGPNGVKKKGGLRFEIKESELYFDCEWDNCCGKFYSMQEFLHHIAAHVASYVANVDDHENCFACGWRECGSQILGNIHDFHRHVYFHAFHVKLKCIGEILVKKGKLPECSIGKQSRNWIPELPENLQCGWTLCGAICDNPVIFYCHVNQHCEEFPGGHKQPKELSCMWTDCRAHFKTKYKLIEHLRTHTQEKVVACPTCGGLFANRTKLFDHLTRQKVSSVYCYQCSHCNKRFATERLLRDHMRHHVNHYKCPYCDMTCPAPSSLRSHFKYRHTLEKPFKCAHCDHCAKSASDLRRHMEGHSADSLFRCSINKCDYSARNYSSLTQHYKKEHQIAGTARYACHICDMRVTRGFQLTKHLKKKHKFRWPPGHSRFRYKMHEDGMYRLQTIRYESIDVTEQIMEEGEEDEAAAQDTVEEDEEEMDEGDENMEPEPLNLSKDQGPPSRTQSQSLHLLPNVEEENVTSERKSKSKSKSKPFPKVEVESQMSNISIQSQCESDMISMSESYSEAPESVSNMSEEVRSETTNDVVEESRSQSFLSMPSSSSFTSFDSSMPSTSQLQSTGVSQNCAEGAAINFTLISDGGEMNVQNLRVDPNGILVFNENETKTEVSEAETENKPFVLAHGSEAYNLEMLGHVALLGENLPKTQS